MLESALFLIILVYPDTTEIRDHSEYFKGKIWSVQRRGVGDSFHSSLVLLTESNPSPANHNGGETDTSNFSPNVGAVECFWIGKIAGLGRCKSALPTTLNQHMEFNF